MSKPLSPDQIVAALKRWGIPYREYAGWRTRGIWRTQRDGFDPRALTVHHTAGNLGGRTVAAYIRDIIVGPKWAAVPDKAQFVIAPDGMLHLVAAGRCNHMAHINQAGLNAITTASLPLDRNANYRGTGINGNKYTYGVECIAAGVPNAAQRKTAVLLAAALCDAQDWDGRETHGHGEMSYDRSNAVGPAGDPGWHMGDLRRDVMALVKAGPSDPAATAPARPVVDLSDVQDACRLLKPILAAVAAKGYKTIAEYQAAVSGPDHADSVLGPRELADLGFTAR